tara:strand:- start:156 stop:632 length:477 start_codon:yes stop_codon:yes gene_type:complete
MIHYVFDLDDTIIMHNNIRHINYDLISEDHSLTQLLDNCKGPRYIYTNGTGGHALTVLNKMNIKHYFDKIYSRDTIPFMKPDERSINDVHNDILYRYQSKEDIIFFFDDRLENLKIAKEKGWLTFWIHPNAGMGNQYKFVTMSFLTIKDCLRYLETKY